MSSVELTREEWQVVINALVMANPVLLKISQQLAAQEKAPPTHPSNVNVAGNGQEARHE